MTCAACLARGQIWSGDPPVCAFEDNAHARLGLKPWFSPENWNCATLNQAREAAESIGCVSRVDDQSHALIATEDGVMYLSWYKRRGRTDAALVLELAGEPVKITPTEDMVLRILAAARAGA